MTIETPLPPKFSNAQYVLSAHTLQQLPADSGREIAFAGRSNVGKSSVINALCNQRGLARTSRTPGRTQQLIVFELTPDRRLIDLPGFGYAHVSKDLREHWHEVIPCYFESRRSLVGLVLVTDARHPLKPQELALLGWCQDAGLKVLVLLNKSDKLGRNGALNALRAAQGVALAQPDLVEFRLCSAQSKSGIAETLDTLGQWFDPRQLA